MTSQKHIENEIAAASPVSFVVMGPKGRHRGVIIRSDDPNLDLIGLDDDLIDWIGESDLVQEKRPSLLRRKLSISSYIVRTDSTFEIDDSMNDSRLSHLSFAWRGLASNKDVDTVRRAFSKMSIDLGTAMKRNDRNGVEWQIAPLVLLCQRLTDNIEEKHERRRTFLLWTATTYAALVLAALLLYYLTRAIP